MEYSKKLIDLFYETEDYAKVNVGMWLGCGMCVEWLWMMDEDGCMRLTLHSSNTTKVLDHSRQLLKFIEIENGFSKDTVVLELL